MSDESGSDDDRRDTRDDDSDDEEVDTKKDTRKKAAAAASDDDDDDDDDDDEDDDDDDDGGRRGKRSRYVDDMAGDDDSDDDEDDEPRSKKAKKSRDYEDEYDDEEAEIDDEQAARLMSDIDQRRNRGPAWLHTDMSDKDFRLRYKQDDDENAPEDENRRNARLPDATKDPKVWCIKVANGTERQIVLQLINKFAILAKAGKPIHVTSAYCNEQALGFVYVEAYKEAYVREALSGLRNVYMTKMKLVPVKEMVDTVTVLKKKLTAQEGSWARCRRGKYKGDICQVLSTDSNRNEVEVKLVPRVDTNDYSEFDEAEAKKRRAKAIPPRRLFDPSNHKEEDLEKWGIEKDRDITWGRGEIVFTYEGMTFNKGFLIKRFPLKSLLLGSDVQPELDELKMFEQGQDEDEAGVAGVRPLHLTSIHKRKMVLNKGDVVRVIGGDLRDLLGDVDHIDGQTVIVRPRHEAIKQKLEFSIDELEKYFEQGDHVKVVGGRKEGVTGTVMNVAGEVITLLTDVNHEEIRVFSSDLQDTNEVSTGMDVVGQFQLYDLVMLEQAASSLTMPSVGVIIKLETDVLQVLDNQGKTRAIRPSDAQPQKKSATAVALDGEQATVGQGDVVKVNDGPNKGKTGTVRHVFRAFLFLYSPSRMEHSGMFVIRSRQCTLMGQSKHTENAGPNAGGPGGGPAGAMAPRGFGGDGPGGRGGGPGGMMAGGRGAGRGRGNSWEGKRVKILKGFDKGKTGTVKEETEQICRIELDATHKKVPIKKSDLVELGKAMPQVRSIPSSTDAHFAAGSQTPMWTPSTPAHDGSVTPNPYNEPGTPSTPRANFFDPNTPSTPMHDNQWDAGTPATPGAYQALPYDQVAATPATPGTSYGGYGSNFVATPGAGLNATTPGEAATPATPGTWNSGGFGSNWQGNTPFEQGTPQTPATPGSELGTGYRAPQPQNWCVPRIEVRVVSGEFIDRVGVVEELMGPDCRVRLVATAAGEATTAVLPSDELEAVPPAKNSSVIILKGELKGSTGKLIGIDGRDGIVKMDLNMDIKIQDMPSLAVYVPAE